MQFNFSDVWWLVLVLAIPAVTALYSLYYKGRIALDRLKAFADAHLLPHLLKNKTGLQQSIARPLILWSIVWACGALAMAGPRWNYTDIQTGMPNRSLVILLDLSKSMDAQDVKPSRLERAKEEIGDLIDGSHATNIGLIAFAAIPHMVVPLTDDMATIRYLMPSLDTSLVGTQGSRVAPALEMAGLMLRGAPGKDKSILIVSDGGMEDLADATQTVPEGVHVYALGIGTSEGAPIPNDGGGWIEHRNGGVVIATLEDGKLKALADAAKGIYVTADYTDGDTHALLSHIEAGPETGVTKKGRMVRIWEEKFYIPALMMALIMLPWFRRGYVFPIVLLLTLWPARARADMGDLFMNPAQQARAAYDQRDFEGAAQKFDTPYRKGVAQYRAQQFDKAEQSFAQDSDPKTKIDSEYNKGNAQLMQGKADDAVNSYEDVLKQRPDDKAAAKNLEIAKKLREQQQPKKDDQKQDQQKDAKNDQKQDQKQDKKQDQKQQDKQQQQQQQAQNSQQQNQQQGKSGDQQQKDKQGQQQQKDQNGEKHQQDKQGEQRQDGQQQQADNGQPQDKQKQDQQQSQSSQNGQQGSQDQTQTAQNQKNQQQEQKGSQDKDKQQQGKNDKGDQQGQQHDQQKAQPDQDKGQQQAQNGQNSDKDKDNRPQGQKGAAEQKSAQNDQKNQPQPQAGAQDDKKNQSEGKNGSDQQAKKQNGGDDKDNQQTAGQQGKQDEQKQADEKASQQAQQKQQEDRQKQQQAAHATGDQDKKEQADNQQQPSNPQGSQDSSGQQQQQQSYESGQQTENQSGKEQPGQVLNGQPHARSQKDVDADQWLNRAVSDPGPFLKNQFNIDARKNPQPEEEDPW